MMGKVIAVWGSPGSGKTTFATKLGLSIYEKYRKTVIVLFCDLETPVLPVIFPNYKSEHLASVGMALSKTEILQDDVIQCLVTVKGKPNYGFLGFRAGENKYTFPRFSEEKAKILIDTLRGISDYVIVDCTSNPENSTLASAAMKYGAETFRLASPDLKSVSWYLSQIPVYEDREYHLDHHIQGINIPNMDIFFPIEELKNHMKEVMFQLPYSHLIKSQMQDGTLYSQSSDRAYEVCMNRIAERIVEYGTS